MAKLKKEVQLYIVRSLAVFNTPQETALLVKEAFNIDVTRQQCEAYDPTKRIGQDLREEFKKEFEATRQDFLDKPKNIPIANRTVRLQRYENEFVRTKNLLNRLKILEQAAKEDGGQYTNKVESSVRNEVSYPSGLGHFYGNQSSGDTESDT